MDPRRLAAVRAGDAEYVQASGSGYVLTPRLVLTALHVVTATKGRQPHQRIDVVIGHPGHGDRQHRSGRLCWAGTVHDVALVHLDRPADVPGEVLWGRPVAGVLDYEALGFPSFARYDDEVARVEHLTGRLPAFGQGLAGGLVLDQSAAPRPRPERRNWAGVSGAAVFCGDCLVGVVVTDDAHFDDRRLHAVPAYAFTQDAEFVRHLEADGGRAPSLSTLTDRGRSHGQSETSPAPQAPAPADELRQLSEEYLQPAATTRRQASPRGAFFGRQEAIRGIEEWLHPAPGTAAATALVVTGGMGSGKSALLRQTALAHDEYGRQTVQKPCTASSRGGWPVLTAHLSLAAMDRARVTRVLGAACGVDAETVADLLTAPAPAEEATPVVLLDALDEADRPEQLCRTLLVPLIETDVPRVRLLIGTRSHRLPLLERPDLVTIDLDSPHYADRKALEHAVRQDLTDAAPDSVWRDAPPHLLAAAVRQVADRGEPSFLLAGLLARALARRPSTALPGTEEWRQLAEDGIHGALRAEAAERLGDRLSWAEGLLRPLAFARGAGLSSAHVWPQAASALSGRRYTAHDITELLRLVGDYLVPTTVTDTAAGDTSFRLAHNALADWLAKGHDEEAAHEAIAQALIGAVPWNGATPDWHAAPRYALDHLTTHAREAHTLHTLLDDPGLLLHSDQTALLAAVNRADVPRTAQALRATTALPRDTPATVRAQILQAAARRSGADTLADRLSDCCCPPRRATRWSRRRLILDDELPTGFESGPRDVIALSWLGQPVCVVLGSRHHQDFLQVFDLETRSPIGDLVPAGRAEAGHLLGSVTSARGKTLVVYRTGDRLRRWSMDDGEHLSPDLLFDQEEERGAQKSARRSTLGRIGERTVAVVATWTDRLYCFNLDADSPQPMHTPQHIDALPLNGLALTTVREEPAVVCLSYGHVECRALGDGTTLSTWEVAGGLTSLVLLDREDRPQEQAMAGFRLRNTMTDDEFAIDLWDPLTGEVLDTNPDYRQTRNNRWDRYPSYETAWTEEFDGRRRLFLSPGRERYERDPHTGTRLGPPCQLRPGAVELTVHGEPHTLGIDKKRLRLRKAGPYARDPFDPSTWPPGGLSAMRGERYPEEPKVPEPLTGVPGRTGTHRGRPVLLVTTPYGGHLNQQRRATLFDTRSGARLAPPWHIPVSPDEVTAIDWAVIQGRLVVLAFHNKLVMDLYQGNASVLLWDPEQPTTVRRMSIGHPGQVAGVHALGAEDLLYLTVDEGPDLLWDTASDTFTPVSCPDGAEPESLHAFAGRGPYLCIPPADCRRLGSGRAWRMVSTDRAEATPIHLLPPEADGSWYATPDALRHSDAVINADGHMTALRARERTYPAPGTALEVHLLPAAEADPEPVRRRWWRRPRSPRIAGSVFELDRRVDQVVAAEDSGPGRFYAVSGSLLTGFRLEWEEETMRDPSDEFSGRLTHLEPQELVPVLYKDHESYDAGARIRHVLPCPGEGVALFTEDGVTFISAGSR
ncbi:hypothetical protein [Streptomyces sp. NPDC005799]|uniref:hypothetical protein n=1 Tax=Streptomyces sp. NPDC005799 TaxID=3154678 RepID=UPI0033C75C72